MLQCEGVCLKIDLVIPNPPPNRKHGNATACGEAFACPGSASAVHKEPFSPRWQDNFIIQVRHWTAMPVWGTKFSLRVLCCVKKPYLSVILVKTAQDHQALIPAEPAVIRQSLPVSILTTHSQGLRHWSARTIAWTAQLPGHGCWSDKTSLLSSVSKPIFHTEPVT